MKGKVDFCRTISLFDTRGVLKERKYPIYVPRMNDNNHRKYLDIQDAGSVVLRIDGKRDIEYIVDADFSDLDLQGQERADKISKQQQK